MNCSIFSIPKTRLILPWLFCAALGGHSYAADFGVANWGMTPAEVKNLESRPNLTPFGEQDYLIYRLSLSGIASARLVYQFQHGQLIQGRFLFRTDNPMDVQTVIVQYRRIKAFLSEQYGPPDKDLVLTRDTSTLMLDPTQYANELASDRLILKSQWRSPTALIKHQLAWNNNRPHHQVVYTPSKEISP
jgi:hypothetical protein